MWCDQLRTLPVVVVTPVVHVLALALRRGVLLLEAGTCSNFVPTLQLFPNSYAPLVHSTAAHSTALLAACLSDEPATTPSTSQSPPPSCLEHVGGVQLEVAQLQLAPRHQRQEAVRLQPSQAYAAGGEHLTLLDRQAMTSNHAISSPTQLLS